MIVLLLKGGEKPDLDSYRGNTLLSIFGKLFLEVLLDRLIEVLDGYKLLNENQIAHRKGHRTSDHLFTLNSIIEEISERKSTLHVCFVDFKKAFDSVNHTLLIEKLLDFGISGKFHKRTTTLYGKVKSCARANDGLTSFFIATVV